MPTTSDRNDPDLAQVDETGMQKKYLVLSPEERGKGFVRPLRSTYFHHRCGQTTWMGQALAETYARDPKFYAGTYCSTCKDHYPTGPDGGFSWTTDGTKVGT